MNVVILAGGLGTRLSEETELRPKPMVEIGERPILWHIMKHYAHHGFTDFHVALGYRGDVVKRYFLDYSALDGDLTIDLASGRVSSRHREREHWTLHLVDTGRDTQTGGRVKRLEPHLSGDTFMATYGDGVADIDLRQLLAFHKAEGKLATITAVRPPARFGAIVFDDNLVSRFSEKPQAGEGWINGGFLVLEPGVFRYLEGDQSSLEADALDALTADRQLAVYRHEGFWQCMDTLRDKNRLEALWAQGRAPWKVWA